MKLHYKKMIAPIVISILVICYCVLYGILIFAMEMPAWVKIAGGVIMVGLIGTMIFVLMERMKEIRKGEEDDLSQY
ncbi:MAG: hypothetical protein Q4E65_01570 [Clostridia bacterium]|nr:hypothetical protein [Clostridia bacterium]